MSIQYRNYTLIDLLVGDMSKAPIDRNKKRNVLDYYTTGNL